MSSLREIKDRIGSVKSTLKITSAMKLVASSKLRKAQKAIEGLRPYEEALDDILSSLRSGGKGTAVLKPASVPTDALPTDGEEKAPGKVAVVAISSNSSLCGGFNANVIRKVSEVIREYKDSPMEVYSLGRRMADAMRKSGFPSPADYTDLIAHPSYDKASALAQSLADRYMKGELEKVVLVYNHFVSSSRQEPVSEVYLPFSYASPEHPGTGEEDDYIVEPSVPEVLESLVPQVLMLKFYAAILDSAAAEHAARTIAMQTATDNAQELLGDLTLEYNKGRQQKITAEILDLVGGTIE